MSLVSYMLLGVLTTAATTAGAALFIQWRRRQNLLNFKAELLLDAVLKAQEPPCS